jgi:hypothetical protein
LRSDEQTLPNGEETLQNSEETLPNGEETLPNCEETLPNGEETLPNGEETLPKVGYGPLEGCEPLPENGEQLYVSPARVLLAGMGIDEQLGGYSRHR